MALVTRVSCALPLGTPNFELVKQNESRRSSPKFVVRSSLSEIKSNEQTSMNRRSVCSVSLLAALATFFASSDANAADIPLFGIKKKAATPAVVASPSPTPASAPASVPEIVTVEAETVSEPSFFTPSLQAGSVVAAEALAVVVASSFVGSILAKE